MWFVVTRMQAKVRLFLNKTFSTSCWYTSSLDFGRIWRFIKNASMCVVCTIYAPRKHITNYVPPPPSDLYEWMDGWIISVKSVHTSLRPLFQKPILMRWSLFYFEWLIDGWKNRWVNMFFFMLMTKLCWPKNITKQ